MSLSSKLAIAWIVATLASCADETRWMRVDRTDPAPGPGQGALAALNQSLTVYLSEPIDPFTVTPESFRVRGPDGHPVPGRIECGTRSVRFVPRPPVAPTLDDGSFVPGGTYRLEVAGMPTSFAVRSRAGRPLERGFALDFQVLDDPGRLGLPTPFLPVDAGLERLRLDVVSAGLPRMAADAAELDLRFNQPVLPTSVRPEAFRIWRILAGAPQSEELQPLQVAVLAEPLPGARHPGSAVRLTFDPAARLQPTDVLYLGLADGDAALRDYRGRAIEELPVPIPVKVDPGDRVRTRDLDLSELRLSRAPDAPLGFEVRGGRIVARAFVEAGSGWAGRLVAGPATTIVSGLPFDRGDGTVRPAAGPALEFESIEVPEGAELRLRAATASLALFACGDLRIRGRVVLEASSRRLPWRPGDAPPVDALLRDSGVALVVGGDVVIEDGGSITVDVADRGCPLVVVAGGDVRIDGTVPPGTGFALRDGARVVGVAEGAVRWRADLTPGLPGAAALRAAAWTEWLPLPAHVGTIDLSVVDPRDEVVAWLQVAPPHSIVVGRPHVEEELVTQPILLPLREPLAVPHGAFVRVRLSGTVRGSSLPSVAGFAIHDR